MATVIGELTLEFETATLVQTIERPLEPATLAALSEPLPLWELGLDLPALVLLWGPLEGLSWAVEVSPTVIPLPASAWLLVGAVAFLATRLAR